MECKCPVSKTLQYDSSTLVKNITKINFLKIKHNFCEMYPYAIYPPAYKHKM